jgi:hypothetical protein
MSDTPAEMFDHICNEIAQIDNVVEVTESPGGVRNPPHFTFKASPDGQQKAALAKVRKYGGHVVSFDNDTPTVTVCFPFAADE